MNVELVCPAQENAETFCYNRISQNRNIYNSEPVSGRFLLYVDFTLKLRLRKTYQGYGLPMILYAKPYSVYSCLVGNGFVTPVCAEEFSNWSIFMTD